MLTKEIKFRDIIAPLMILKELAESVLTSQPEELDAALKTLLANLHLAKQLVEYWRFASTIAAEDMALSIDFKSEIVTIGRSLAAVGYHLLVTKSHSLAEYEKALKVQGLFDDKHGFENLQVFWSRLEAMTMAKSELHHYPDLQHPFTLWYASLKMNEIFTKPHKLRSHFIDWLMPKHVELLSREALNVAIDTLIEHQSHVVRLVQTLLFISLAEGDDEDYKHQVRLNYSLERALLCGNLEVANAITQPAPYGLTSATSSDLAMMNMVPVARMQAQFPKEVNKIVHCLHLALESKSQRFIDLVLANYNLDDLFKISLNYPSLVLARFTFEHCAETMNVSIEQVTPLARLASRCGDVALLNKILQRCSKQEASILFENTIKNTFIPARDPAYLWLTADRSDEYRKNQRTYRRLFLDNAAMLASHMRDNTFCLDFEDNLTPNLNFLGRMRRAMAYAVHPNLHAVSFGSMRNEQGNTRRKAEYEEYFDACQEYMRNVFLDQESHYNRVVDVVKIKVFIAPHVTDVTINQQHTELPITTYLTHTQVRDNRCEIWVHPPHTTLPKYHALLRELYALMENQQEYLRTALMIYFYSTHGLLWDQGSAACNDMKMHALLYKAEMLLPYETIGRCDCLAFSCINVNDFIDRWPSLLGLNSLEDCVNFLKTEYQLHCKTNSIEMTASGTLRLISVFAAEPLQGKISSQQQPSILKHLVKKYLPEENPPFANEILEKCFRAVAAKGSPQECRFLLAVVDVNACNEKSSKNTALHFAVMYGRLQIVKILLEQPTINKAAKNAEGYTPWHYIAKHKKNSEFHQALLEAYPKPAQGFAPVFK